MNGGVGRRSVPTGIPTGAIVRRKRSCIAIREYRRIGAASDRALNRAKLNVAYGLSCAHEGGDVPPELADRGLSIAKSVRVIGTAGAVACFLLTIITGRKRHVSKIYHGPFGRL